MSDKELLELAAKAAGYLNWTPRAEGLYIETGSSRGSSGFYWNPLDDDGDALRLAVKFLFEIDLGRGCTAVRHSSGIKILEAFNQNPQAATRRAIVRAAAEIGKEMK